MKPERDHYLLIADAARTALLVVGSHGRVGVPRVRGRAGAAGVLEAVKTTFSLEASYLRCAQVLRDESGQPIAGLHELDSPDPDWNPTSGSSWLQLDEIDPVEVAPSQFAPAVERWLAEQRGASISDARPPWARQGWFAEASRWMEDTSAARGLHPLGRVELVAQWPLSSVLRLETDGGRVYFKAVFSAFRHEPAVTDALSRQHPGLVPDVLAVDDRRGWMLMRELRGVQLGDTDVSGWVQGLRAASAFHRSWVGREAELFGLGAHDRTLSALARDMHRAFETIELSQEERTRLKRAVPELERLCLELADRSLPETLVHGDLHPWNVMVDGEELKIFDWSDSSVSHPLFDLPTFLGRVQDEGVRESMLDAYLDAWRDLGSRSELRTQFDLSRPLARVHHAISYLRISEALEPDDRWWVASEPTGWLVSAIELVEAKR